MHVLHNCIEYVQGEHDPDPSAAAANVYMEEGDGMARWAAGRDCSGPLGTQQHL